MKHGVTPQGFSRKRYPDLLAELENRARTPEYFGEEADLQTPSPLSCFLRLIAWSLSDQWQLAEAVYYSLFVDTADGVSLDRVCRFGGVERLTETKAEALLTFHGQDGATVPAGTIARTGQGRNFTTLEEGILKNGACQVRAMAEEPGPEWIVPSGAINEIATNENPSHGGRLREKDAPYRMRHSRRRSGSQASIPALIDALSNIDGMRSANVFVNDTDREDNEGRPSHSVEVVTDGGTDEEISRTLWRFYCGLQYVGEKERTIEAKNGQRFQMRWNTPKNRSLFVTVEIRPEPGFRESEKERIQEAVIRHIGGVATVRRGEDISSIEYEGLAPGESVFSWKVASALREIRGIRELSVFVGTKPDEKSPVVSLAGRERAFTDSEKVAVHVLL